MTVEERLTALEQEVAALKGETYDGIERRLARNADAQAAATRAAQPRYDDHRRGNKELEMRPHLARERQLLAWLEEVDAKLAAHLATRPSNEGSVEFAIWNREREVLEETRAEVLHGPSEFSSGRLREMAKRDGASLMPGLNRTRQTLAELRQELAVLG